MIEDLGYIDPSVSQPQACAVVPRIRGWHRHFHRATGPQGNSQREAQLEDLQARVARGDDRDVLRHLDEGTVPLLAARLEACQALSIAWEAYRQCRYDQALALLVGASLTVSGTDHLRQDHLRQDQPADQQENQRLNRLLLEALCWDRLGQITAARLRFEQVLESAHATESEGEWDNQACQASMALAWIDLRLGAWEDASARMRALRQLVPAGQQRELDRLKRLLSTLKTLNDCVATAIPHHEDLSRRFSIAVALDGAALSRCGTVLEVEGWLVDPRQQIEKIYLVREQRVWPFDLAETSRSERPDLEELVKRCGGNSGYQAGLKICVISQPEECLPLQANENAILILALKEGKHIYVSQKIKAFNLNTKHVKSLINAAIDDRYWLTSPELLRRTRQLWSQKIRSRLEAVAEHYIFGEAEANPDLSIVVPLYGRVDFMEYQLNWFGAWRQKQSGTALKIQLIYVLDDPSLMQDCLALAKRCQLLYAMPFELITNQDNTGYAAANNRGVQYAKAAMLLLMNSDVLPAKDESFDLMYRALQQQRGRIGALGALLLFENGAIQHQSMQFQCNESLDGELSQVWLNEHPCKGMTTTIDPAQALELQEVEAASAACLMLPLKLFNALGGFSLDYIVGDFEDSDLCLKIRDFGLAIAVDLSATFFHLERQSVSLHSQSSKLKMKLVTANACTHHQRWCSTIERLKASAIEP